jgi:hypothetical protein
MKEGCKHNVVSEPYKIDIALYESIENPDVTNHIRRVGIIFYRKN